MTKDELITHAEEVIKAREHFNTNGWAEPDLTIYKIALATLKADKMGLRMCEVRAKGFDLWCPVRTELDDIMKGLE